MADTIDTITGVDDTLRRILNETTREALHELLPTAVRLRLAPRLSPRGKETAFSFGPRRYPLCRVNIAKGIAFHYSRNAGALIIRSTDDQTFRLAARRAETHGAVGLTRSVRPMEANRVENREDAAHGMRAEGPMHLVHTEYDPTGLIVPTATYGEIADMADVAIRAGEDLDPDVREDRPK